MKDRLKEARDILEAAAKADKHFWTKGTVDTTISIPRKALKDFLLAHGSTIGVRLAKLGWSRSDLVRDVRSSNDKDMRVPAKLLVDLFDTGPNELLVDEDMKAAGVAEWKSVNSPVLSKKPESGFPGVDIKLPVETPARRIDEPTAVCCACGGEGEVPHPATGAREGGMVPCLACSSIEELDQTLPEWNIEQSDSPLRQTWRWKCACGYGNQLVLHGSRLARETHKIRCSGCGEQFQVWRAVKNGETHLLGGPAWHSQSIWETQDGRRSRISEMTDDHLLNCMRYLKRKAERFGVTSTQSKWYHAVNPGFFGMKREAEKRGLIDNLTQL